MFVVVLIVISDNSTGQLQALVIVMGMLGEGKVLFHIKLNPF
jgi:hypothetical protein